MLLIVWYNDIFYLKKYSGVSTIRFLNNGQAMYLLCVNKLKTTERIFSILLKL